MRNLQLFTDASVNNQSKLGFAAYLLVGEKDCSLELYKSQVKTKRFEQTSSTKLELQSLLWALNEVVVLTTDQSISLRIYTDCQNIMRLPDRRVHLENSQYLSSKNKPLNHSLLYQEFYQLTDHIHCTFVKVIGHQKANQKVHTDRLFSLVDKASRQALRAAI